MSRGWRIVRLAVIFFAGAVIVDAIVGERGLLATGSADFHGPDHKLFHRFRAFDLFGLEPDLGPIG